MAKWLWQGPRIPKFEGWPITYPCISSSVLRGKKKALAVSNHRCRVVAAFFLSAGEHISFHHNRQITSSCPATVSSCPVTKRYQLSFIWAAFLKWNSRDCNQKPRWSSQRAAVVNAGGTAFMSPFPGCFASLALCCIPGRGQRCLFSPVLEVFGTRVSEGWGERWNMGCWPSHLIPDMSPNIQCPHLL